LLSGPVKSHEKKIAGSILLELTPRKVTNPAGVEVEFTCRSKTDEYLFLDFQIVTVDDTSLPATNAIASRNEDGSDNRRRGQVSSTKTIRLALQPNYRYLVCIATNEDNLLLAHVTAEIRTGILTPTINLELNNSYFFRLTPTGIISANYHSKEKEMTCFYCTNFLRNSG
jgi:hypothetical protein